MPLQIVSGNGQTGLPRKTLEKPLSVSIRDSVGNPVAHVAVHWRAEDGGSVFPDSTLTDENGIASAHWTLGLSDGIQHASAQSDDGFVRFEAIVSRDLLAEPTLLSLLTPDGSGQTVHPDFGKARLGWSLARNFLVVTPYPNGNANFENPSIFTAANFIDWSAVPGVANPLARPGLGEYLSDPDIVFVPEREELYVYYRAAGARNIVRVIRSGDGVRFTAPLDIASAPNHDLVSPAVVRRAPNDWMMWSVNARSGCSGSAAFVELRRSVDGLHWGEPERVDLDQPGFFPWHIDVQWIPSRSEFWAVYNGKTAGSCTTRALFLAVSSDGVAWRTFPSAILERGVISAFEDVVYRSTFAYDPAVDVVDFWYSGARYDGRNFVWRSAHQRRSREEVFASASRTGAASLAAGPETRERGVPELRDPP